MLKKFVGLLVLILVGCSTDPGVEYNRIIKNLQNEEIDFEGLDLAVKVEDEIIYFEFANNRDTPIEYADTFEEKKFPRLPKSAVVKVRNSVGKILSRKDFTETDWWTQWYLSSDLPVLPLPMTTLGPHERIEKSWKLRAMLPGLELHKLDDAEIGEFIEIKVQVSIYFDGYYVRELSTETEWLRFPASWVQH